MKNPFTKINKNDVILLLNRYKDIPNEIVRNIKNANSIISYTTDFDIDAEKIRLKYAKREDVKDFYRKVIQRNEEFNLNTIFYVSTKSDNFKNDVALFFTESKDRLIYIQYYKNVDDEVGEIFIPKE